MTALTDRVLAALAARSPATGRWLAHHLATSSRTILVACAELEAQGLITPRHDLDRSDLAGRRASAVPMVLTAVGKDLTRIGRNLRKFAAHRD